MINYKFIGAAQVTPKGIIFLGLYYSSYQAIREQWYEKASESGKWTIEVYFDPINLSKIFYRIMNSFDEFEECNVLQPKTLKGSKLDKYFKSIQKLKCLRKKCKENKRFEGY